MKKILLLSLLISFVFISCKKDDEDNGPLVIEKIEYHIDTNVDNSMIKYINANGGEELVLIGTLLPPLMPGREAALAYEVRSPYVFATLLVFGVLTWLLWTVKGGNVHD